LGTYVYLTKKILLTFTETYINGGIGLSFFLANHSCHEFESFCYKVGGNYIDFAKKILRLELGSIWL
jgi:hypothetical protein